jgi:hypothetical protein
MKTSNIILLSFLLLIIAGITASVFIVNSKINKNIIFGDGNITKEIRNVDDFKNLNVTGNFTIYFTQDAVQSVRLEADNNIIEHLVIKTEDETLIIKSNSMVKSSNLDVYISSASLKNITLTGGSQFKTQANLVMEEMKINANGGVSLDIQGDFSILDLFLNAGSTADIKGNCNDFYIQANAGSRLKAKEFNAQNASISATAGSNLEVNATSTLSVEASAGSSVYYYGNPELRNINTSSGANLQKR